MRSFRPSVGDAIGAAAGAGEYMLDTLDLYGVAEGALENFELGAAEALADPSRGADRTVILGKEEGAVGQQPASRPYSLR